jgi:hypothetical protein
MFVAANGLFIFENNTILDLVVKRPAIWITSGAPQTFSFVSNTFFNITASNYPGAVFYISFGNGQIPISNCNFTNIIGSSAGGFFIYIHIYH